MLFEPPSHFFLSTGSADGGSVLNAFDRALLAAGVGDVNLVRLSSILPPGCEQVEPFELPGGSLVPTAYAEATSSNPGETIAAAVAVAVPENSSEPGLIMEHHGVCSLDDATGEVREMALRGMRHRERPVADILSTGSEHVVDRHGAAFAGVVLWNGPGNP